MCALDLVGWCDEGRGGLRGERGWGQGAGCCKRRQSFAKGLERLSLQTKEGQISLPQWLSLQGQGRDKARMSSQVLVSV